MTTKKLSLLFIALGVFFLLSGCSDALPEDQQVDYEDVHELLEEVSDEYTTRGSCNTIDDSSVCIDYIGSFWTDEQMQYNCEGAGTFSKNTCPYSTIGGCKNMDGTVMETVIWYYNYGGDPITEENLPYVSGVCEANPACHWTTADGHNLVE